MAKTATTTKKGAKARKKAAPQPVDEVDDDELEETDEDGEEEAQPYGVRDICALIKAKTGDDVKPRDLRTLIRKMARDGSGRVERDIIPGNKTKYEWSGPNDPEVKAILKAYTAGELAADRAEKLAALKERKAAQKAAGDAKGKTKAKAKTKKTRPAPEVVEDDDDELDDDDE